MPSNLPQFTFRISLTLLNKLHYIAEQNSRSTNKELEMLVKKHIADYERKNGEIPTHTVPED